MPGIDELIPNALQIRKEAALEEAAPGRGRLVELLVAAVAVVADGRREDQDRGLAVERPQVMSAVMACG